MRRMVDLISQLGQDAISASDEDGQQRSLLMQQEQLGGFKKTADSALHKASSAMARITCSLFLPAGGVPRTLKEDFEKLSRAEGDGSQNLWHQMRYHRDRSAWVDERDALLVKVANAQTEADELRSALGVSLPVPSPVLGPCVPLVSYLRVHLLPLIFIHKCICLIADSTEFICSYRRNHSKSTNCAKRYRQLKTRVRCMQALMPRRQVS